jgi:serine protease Do
MKFNRPIARMTLGGGMLAAFVGGLVFASGLDLTRSSYAQTQTTASSTIAPIVPANVTELSGALTSIAETMTPAVVSIHAERTRSQAQPNQQRRPQSLEDFFGPGRQQPVQGSGSGFIVSEDGHILTNNHVVDGFDRLEVTLTDRRTFPAKVIGRDETTDVAVLKIDGGRFPYVRLGDDHATRVGEFVMAIGNPLGLEFTVTFGIVSAKGRGRAEVQVNRNNWAITDFIQTDAAINPGNSGGPLVNVRGEVIGINTAIASQTGTYAGYGFAVPITLAKEVLDDFLKYGRVRRAMLGVQINEVDAQTAAVAGLKQISGVLVQPYAEDAGDSPARRAGIEAGDVITHADGQTTDRVNTLQRIIRTHEPGETVKIDVMRYGNKRSFNVRLGEATDSVTRVASNVRPEPDPERPDVSLDKLGITVEPITEEQAERGQIAREHRGLRIVEIDRNSSQRDRWLQNDVLLAVINPTPRRELRTAADLQRVLNSARDGSYLSLMVYNLELRQSRIVNVRVGE